MTSLGALDEQKSVRLRQRLWGAAVFIALLVIFLPLLLDGSGSESQYRRVERLRAEPPRILDEQGLPEQSRQAPVTSDLLPEPNEAAQLVQSQPIAAIPALSPQEIPASRPQPAAKVPSETLSAWVVQAGSFGQEANALAVRDKLRRAGFPSFVTQANTSTPLFRVRVGPMINLQQAERSRDKVMRLLEREAIVVNYP